MPKPPASPPPPDKVALEDDWTALDLGGPKEAALPPLAALQPAPSPELPPLELSQLAESEPEKPIALAPMHEFVPPAEQTGHKPEAAAVAAPADGGEAQLREALSQASREVIERIAWEVVPQLAETIIREQVDRLVKERQGQS